MAIQKQLKFVKETNGDVILYTLSGQLIASFNEAQTILREAGDLNRFRIVTEINDPGFLFDYRFIDSLSCFPMIIENGINEFLIELSKKFFSGAKAQSGNLNLPIAFLELRLKSKGSNLCIPNKGSGIEIGDLVEGFKDANIYWESAMYKGGYKEDRNNYTPVLEHKMDYYCGTAPVVPPVVEPVVPPVVEPVVPPVVEPVVPPVVEPVVPPVVEPVVPPVIEPIFMPLINFYYQGYWESDDTFHNPKINSWVDYLDENGMQFRQIINSIEFGCQLVRASSIVSKNGCNTCTP